MDAEARYEMQTANSNGVTLHNVNRVRRCAMEAVVTLYEEGAKAALSLRLVCIHVITTVLTTVIRRVDDSDVQGHENVALQVKKEEEERGGC